MSRAALLFRVEKETFALPLDCVTEVVRAAWPMRAPRAPFGCLGVLDVRGQLVPLLDMAATLGLRRVARAKVLLQRLVDSHVLLVGAHGSQVGFLVDQVLEVGEESMELTEPEHQRVQAAVRPGGVVTGLATAAHLRALLLDPTALVGERRQRLLQRAVAAVEAGGGP